MYEIMSVVYGKVVTKDDVPKLLKAIGKHPEYKEDAPTDEQELGEWLEGASYFDAYYCGSDGESLGFIGENIYDIDCTCDGRGLSEVIKEPSIEQLQKAHKKLNDLKEDLGIWYEPSLQFYWSTS